MLSETRMADAVVSAWHQKLPIPLSAIDLIALRSHVAQALVVVASEKDKEIAELKSKLGVIHGTAREVLEIGGDRNV